MHVKIRSEQIMNTPVKIDMTLMSPRKMSGVNNTAMKNKKSDLQEIPSDTDSFSSSNSGSSIDLNI